MQRIFLSWARPLAPALAAAVYGVLEVVTPSPRVLHLIFVLLGSIVAGVVYRFAARRFTPTAVLRVALPIDTLLIAGMTAALDRPALLAITYFWPIAVTALLLGPGETLGVTLLTMACAGVVPYLVGHRVDSAVVVTDLVALGLIGGLLSLLPISVAAAESVLARQRRVDAAALRIAERIRATLDFDEIVEYALEEMARATGASRSVLRLTDDLHFFQHVRPGIDPLSPESSPPLRRVKELKTPLVVSDRAEVAGDPELLTYMEEYGAHALIAYPLLEGGRVTGVAGFHDMRPRKWRDAVMLLDRIVPQLAAALSQARLFARQSETVERLEELARIREELVATVSHELRTPLTTTIGFLRTLRREDTEFTDEQRDEFIGLALAQAERLADLVNDLLELTRVERGGLPLEPREVDLVEVVLAVCETAPGLPVLDLEPELPARVDPGRIRQVLENLVANAYRHGRGDVTIHGARLDARIRLEIADEGPDIPEDVVPHLFVPFARWGTSEGSGLGLAIARGLVEAHGGTLVYRPSRDGRPHAFVVELPST